MTFLPIVHRELIVRARSAHMHWVRVALAALGVLLCLQYFLLWTGLGVIQVGGYAFQTLAWMVFLLANAGFLLTADSVSSERREGTLGFLLLTRVGIPDVLAGKLTSSGLGAMLALVAITPVLMMPVLAGGVRWVQVVLVALSLPGMLFFSLCTGLWASSKSIHMRQALTRSVVCLAVMVILPLILGGLQTVAGAEVLGRWMQSLSPGSAFIWGSSGAATFAHGGYWISVAAGFVFGGILLAAAANELQGNWRNNTDPDAVRSDPPQKRRIPVGDDPPLRWLFRRSKRQSLIVWLGSSLLLLPGVMTGVMSAVGLPGAGISSALHLATSFAAYLLFSYTGAMFFLEGRRSGALELLRTTPVGSQRIVADQWLVLRQCIAGPIMVFITVTILLKVAGWTRFPGMVWISYVPQAIGGVVGTVFDVIALCWLGMWFGYRARTTQSALRWPVGLVAGLDLVFTYMLYGGFALLLRGAALRGGPRAVWIALYLTVPGLLTIAKQIWLIRWAKRRLLREKLSTAALAPMDVGQLISVSARRAMASVQKARHWTPGGGA